MEYLTPEDPKPSRFYLLPTIHRENNPGRQIVSANGYQTEQISEFIDFHLRPFVENHPSHIKDTTDYLKIMKNLTIPENTTLVIMDVSSLYINIPHDDIIAACRKIWEQRTVQEPPTECVVEILTLVLKNNNVTFDGNHYLQINGTAMGTKMAPSCANICAWGTLKNDYSSPHLSNLFHGSGLLMTLKWSGYIAIMSLMIFSNMPTVSIRLYNSHMKCRKPK